jgi:hypothetical protein
MNLRTKKTSHAPRILPIHSLEALGTGGQCVEAVQLSRMPCKGNLGRNTENPKTAKDTLALDLVVHR